MPNIDELAIITDVSIDDLTPVYSQNNGDTFAISISNLAKVIQSLITAPDNKITQYVSPASNALSIQINDSNLSVFLIITPTGVFATETLILPLKSNCIDKQEILIVCTQTITTLTINGNGATIIGAPTTLVNGSYFTLRYDFVTSTWYRVN